MAHRGPPVRPARKLEALSAGMIPADDVERVVEGAEQAQREDAGFGEQIAAKRLGVKESDDDRRDDE